MVIQTKEINGAQVIRILSGPVTGSDISAARDFIQRRVDEGQGIFILSIEQSHKESFVACGLIVICAEEIRAGEAVRPYNHRHDHAGKRRIRNDT
jgi:hypothetical protein